MLVTHPFLVNSSAGDVHAWSIERLPFEPKGEMARLRAEIRQGLHAMALSPGEGEVLHACYWSRCESLVDTENVLLYNVGSSHFSHLAKDGIRFERAFRQPPSLPEALRWTPKHYHCYGAARRQDGFASWRRGQTLATWNDVECGPISSSLKAAPVWLAIKRAAHIVAAHTGQPPKRFGLSIRLHHGSKAATIQLAGILKPLLDGIIAAFHQYKPRLKQDAEVVQRLALVTGQPDSEIVTLLNEPTVLEPRRVVHCWGSGLQWNPKDEDCMVAQLLRVQEPGAGGVRVSGQLFEVFALDA